MRGWGIRTIGEGKRDITTLRQAALLQSESGGGYVLHHARAYGSVGGCLSLKHVDQYVARCLQSVDVEVVGDGHQRHVAAAQVVDQSINIDRTIVDVFAFIEFLSSSKQSRQQSVGDRYFARWQYDSVSKWRMQAL